MGDVIGMEEMVNAATQGGLAVVGLILVLWVVRILIPRMEQRHEAEVTRLLMEAERARHVHLETIERVVTSHERNTNRIIERLNEIGKPCSLPHVGRND